MEPATKETVGHCGEFVAEPPALNHVDESLMTMDDLQLAPAPGIPTIDPEASSPA